MLSTVLIFVLNGTQHEINNYPNINYIYLNESNPSPLFHILLHSKSQDELYRICIIILSNGIAFCPNWQISFNELEFTCFLPVFNLLLKPPTEQQINLVDCQSPGIFHELVIFLYQSLLCHTGALASLQNGREFIVSLLFPLQLLNEKQILSYFHSIVLSSLVMLTSNEAISESLNEPFVGSFQCRHPVHRGTYADLLIEIITNVIGNDFTISTPLLPSIACIFNNISAHVHSFSYFVCNRIFHFFQMLIESRNSQTEKLIQIMVDGFTQILSEQFEKNKTMLIFMMRNFGLFRVLKQRGIDVKYVFAFAHCFRAQAKAMQARKVGANEAEIVLKSIKPSMFIGGYVPIGPRGHVFSGEMSQLWTDWMRTIATRNGSFKSMK